MGFTNERDLAETLVIRPWRRDRPNAVSAVEQREQVEDEAM